MQDDDVAAEGDSVSLREVLVLAMPFGLLVAHAPSMFVFDGYTTRMAIVLIAGACGFPGLVRMVRSRDRSAVAASLLAGWIVIAGMLSGAPMQALKGSVGRELTGLIAILGLGVWALGRSIAPRIVELVPQALLAGLGVNALVGVLQLLYSTETGWLSMQAGRANGLTSSPVYFGALMAAGVALAAGWRDWTLTARVGGVATFAFALDLSGSRVAVLAALVAVALAVLLDREELNGVRAAALPMGFVAGIGMSTLAGGLVSTTRTSAARLAGTEAGGRFDAWRYGVEAAGERPVFGYGFGRFRSATQARFSDDFVRSAASDDLRQAWFDAHNVVVSVLVAIGIVGLGLVVWFVVAASQRLDRRLALIALTIALTWLMQPIALATFPLVMFVLGCASTRRAHREGLLGVASPPATSTQVTFLVGLVAAGWLLVGDLWTERAIDRGDVDALERSATFFPHDAVVADLVAQGYFVRAAADPTLGNDVLNWSSRALDYEPDRPYLWRQHGARLFVLGYPQEAIAALESAVELQPWHLQSWQGMYVVASSVGDDQLRDRSRSKLCDLHVAIDDAPC